MFYVTSIVVGVLQFYVKMAPKINCVWKKIFDNAAYYIY